MNRGWSGAAPIGLPGARRKVLYLIATGLWLSGLGWLVFHYGLRQKTDFGYTSHPLEHWSLTVHGIFAMAAVWMFGVLWAVHIQAGWRRRQRRWSGGALFAVLLWLCLSGLGLYYLEHPELRAGMAIAHWAAGLACLAAFAVHWTSRTR